MSADNGIFILISPSANNPEEKEYRVAEGSDSSMRWASSGLTSNKETNKFFSFFYKDSSVYTDPLSAMKRAEEIENEFHREGWPLEYGIMEIVLDRPFPVV